ncbi:MAG: hypothetical protein IKR48_04810, partial [Kiritimatiellae bacterium]|nr:hypothetical protein [Kiritimatiellia bacterium]
VVTQSDATERVPPIRHCNLWLLTSQPLSFPASQLGGLAALRSYRQALHLLVCFANGSVVRWFGSSIVLPLRGYHNRQLPMICDKQPATRLLYSSFFSFYFSLRLASPLNQLNTLYQLAA